MDSVRNKLKDILDQGSFKELWPDLYTYNYLEFTGYDEKLRIAKEKSVEKDSVITGVGMIAGCKCIIAVFEPCSWENRSDRTDLSIHSKYRC
ncbi:MAG: hypothetical protein ACLSVG_06245 [Clostridia bacterium]